MAGLHLIEVVVFPQAGRGNSVAGIPFSQGSGGMQDEEDVVVGKHACCRGDPPLVVAVELGYGPVIHIDEKPLLPAVGI